MDDSKNLILIERNELFTMILDFIQNSDEVKNHIQQCSFSNESDFTSGFINGLSYSALLSLKCQQYETTINVQDYNKLHDDSERKD